MVEIYLNEMISFRLIFGGPNVCCHMRKGPVILSVNIGDICKIFVEDDQLFLTHYFTNFRFGSVTIITSSALTGLEAFRWGQFGPYFISDKALHPKLAFHRKI